MTDAGADAYSPQRRTALVLTGTGADGAYHAGALRALHEAGVKIDLVAGRGVGVIGAVFAAVDGAQRLWDEKGFWRSAAVDRFYGWRVVPKIVGGALAISVAIVAIPIAAVAAGLIVFPIDFLLKIVGGAGAPGLVAAYLSFAQRAFAADALPTWLPRLVLLVLGLAAAIALVDGLRAGDGRLRGGAWWRLVRAPLDAHVVASQVWHTLWDLIRGAAHLSEPGVGELAQRYTELLTENLGQPGFRELVIVAHDVDAHRDLVFALVAEGRRRDLVRRPTTEAADARRAEVFDLAGVDRQHLSDAVAASLTLPLATDWRHATFNPDGYWRGETHRLADRPASLVRLLDELIELGAEQIVLVAAAPQAPGPHALARGRLDPRGRLGEFLQSAEAAIVHDATTTTAGVRIFTIRPAHNPIAPFDFAGGDDDRSHRRQPLAELMSRGYEDAYHQFIEPVVGAFEV
ncbi:MAG TPA: patatin-like phospholipase family protein [Vicinamibacterales bacterium]|nr:patatin-like phospholipase family protein [Vicinamibacterales bacterium]